ncbi:MAG: hypothetical protein QMD85_03100 [Candidatus Aenigmarchaeota archaeon]|nr:hypothetical protein [Candidatus Aenigmarchaeota archaeon]MDI6722519.1 hypothetical protein [Candidatus Aenigmarchaeota archaeon]
MKVYHSENCGGLVAADFSVNGKKVTVVYEDGGISTLTITYRLKKSGSSYVVIRNHDLDTPLDAQFGKNPQEKGVYPLSAESEEDAISSMIGCIVKPHEDAGQGFNVNPEDLRTALDAALFGKPYDFSAHLPEAPRIVKNESLILGTSRKNIIT